MYVFPYGGKSLILAQYLYFQSSITLQFIWTAWFQSWTKMLRPRLSGWCGCLVSEVLGLVLGGSVRGVALVSFRMRVNLWKVMSARQRSRSRQASRCRRALAVVWSAFCPLDPVQLCHLTHPLKGQGYGPFCCPHIKCSKPCGRIGKSVKNSTDTIF